MPICLVESFFSVFLTALVKLNLLFQKTKQIGDAPFSPFQIEAHKSVVSPVLFCSLPCSLSQQTANKFQIVLQPLAY